MWAAYALPRSRGGGSVTARPSGPRPAGRARRAAATRRADADAADADGRLYHYALFGRMVVTRGLNPYVTPPSALARRSAVGAGELAGLPDPLRSRVHRPVRRRRLDWRRRPIATALAFKTLATGSAPSRRGRIALAGREGRSGLLPLSFIAWNPLALIETAGSGHNEMVMIGLALPGCWSSRAAAPASGFRAAGGSAHVKWVTAAAVGPGVRRPPPRDGRLCAPARGSSANSRPSRPRSPLPSIPRSGRAREHVLPPPPDDRSRAIRWGTRLSG